MVAPPSDSFAACVYSGNGGVLMFYAITVSQTLCPDKIKI